MVAAQWRSQRVYRPNSATKVDGVFSLYLTPTFGDRPIGRITTNEVRTWLATERMQKLSPATRRTALRYFRSVIHKAIEDGLLVKDPSAPVKVPGSKGKPVTSVLTQHQVSLLIKAAPDSLRPVVMVAAGTGLRQGEVLGLTTRDVDLDRGLIHVRQQWVLKQGELGPLKTDSSLRTVPLAPALVDVLRPIVETTETGQVLFPLGRTAEYLWLKSTRGAGVSARFHDLRHYFASVLIRAGADVKTVQTLLGHTDAAMTLNTYSHYFHGSADDTVRAAIQGLFSGDHETPVKPHP
ncbi:site-specific integrase [Streptomyces sp. NBC_00006]|uniref:tyrosine-type recombinase/integrase n=1 Tax=Streptomyces sp. NBC_00006 TaxID=2975619 RepID=UPI0022508711|nr:site-specific integrase [Streptomyces sp. NBC_00006]MCX5535417.1 site-specific integrase [Streptomyces sp. NBC_00006]